MKTFDEYREYLNQQLKHLIINNDQDLLNFTKLLLNYGKVALKFYPKEIAKLAHKYKFYGIKEYEMLDHIKEIKISNQKVFISTKNKTYIYPLISVADEVLKKENMEPLDMLLLLSLTLDNKQQGLFQLINKNT